MPNQFSASTFHLLSDLYHVCLESAYLFVCHFHRPINLQNSSYALVEENIELGLVAFNHSPSFATIERDNQYTRSKNPQLGVYAELTVPPDVL